MPRPNSPTVLGRLREGTFFLPQRSRHPQIDEATSSYLGESAGLRVGKNPQPSPAVATRVPRQLLPSSPTRGPSALHEKEPSWGGGKPPGIEAAIDSRKGRLGRACGEHRDSLEGEGVRAWGPLR
jgi:hypothetical protein